MLRQQLVLLLPENQLVSYMLHIIHHLTSPDTGSCCISFTSFLFFQNKIQQYCLEGRYFVASGLNTWSLCVMRILQSALLDHLFSHPFCLCANGKRQKLGCFYFLNFSGKAQGSIKLFDFKSTRQTDGLLHEALFVGLN